MPDDLPHDKPSTNNNRATSAPNPQSLVPNPYYDQDVPPRYSYWTILIDGAPTAFRAAEQADLAPTVGQLKRTNADVVLKWFSAGKVWDSPEAQQEARRRPSAPREKRNREWRPGDKHEDPRARFKKKRR
jgi:hypothetical protein